MKKLFKYLDKLITKSESKTGLYTLQKLFTFGIPFNKPHAIKFKQLAYNNCSLTMANKRINHNHLGGIHACAIATLGEFTAGLLLCKNFEMAKYRVIMKDIHVEYFLQARTAITSHSQVTKEEITALKNEALKEDKAMLTLKTLIKNELDEEVALVATTWQLKDWSKAKMQ